MIFVNALNAGGENANKAQMTRQVARVKAIYRYPVKGLSPQPLIRTPRPRSTPDTGIRDLPIPRTILETYGHADCGVYGEVTASGPIKIDSASSISTMPAVAAFRPSTRRFMRPAAGSDRRIRYLYKAMTETPDQRKERLAQQAIDGAKAMNEYREKMQALHRRTARLRAERLAREAAQDVGAPKAKS